jgi:TRAP-type mannitol/chloroaromatic compound transport system permease small subunit
MRGLARLGNGLARIAILAGRLGSWACVPLVAFIIVDVISRRFFGTGSTMLQELEWHFHALLFLLCLGYAYIRNAHVRIDLVREHMGERSRDLLELLGFVLILAPFCAIMIWYGVDIAWRSFEQGEGSPNPGGLPNWWLIKSAVPLGLALLLVAGAAIAIRKFLLLYAAPELRREVLARVHAETQGATDERRS